MRDTMVKVGLRKPSLKKSIKARTTAKMKRNVKGKVMPWYGKRGIGWLHPVRKVKGSIYQRTTFSLGDIFKAMQAPKGGRAGQNQTAKTNRIIVLGILGYALRYWYVIVVLLLVAYFKFR